MQRELSGQDIRAVTFQHEKRRGYQMAAVDSFVQQVAGYVEELQAELADQQHTERSAMLLLQQARLTADMTTAEATAGADAIRAAASEEARQTIESARAEARQRMDGAEAQIEAAFADASARLNELEHQIQGRGRELALLEAASARFAADQATLMREQAEALLAAAASITSSGRADTADGAVAADGGEPGEVDLRDAPDRPSVSEDVVDG